MKFKPSIIEGAVLPDHPLYAEKLDSEEFKDAESPIVQAAYDIMCEAHAGQMRNQKSGMDGRIAYITHPIMVCKLLKHIKNALPTEYADRKWLTQEEYLAVALLHDVLEEKGTPYYHRPNILETVLTARIANRVVTARLADELECPESEVPEAMIAEAEQRYYSTAGKWPNLRTSAEIIVKDCVALCNPEEMKEGKRVYQVEHIQCLTPRQKLIKMLDQVASVMEDSLFERKSHSPEQTLAFFFKALDLVSAGAATGSDEHKLVESFFLRLFERYAQLYKQYGEKDPEGFSRQFAHNQEHLSIEDLMQKALDERAHHLEEKQKRYQVAAQSYRLRLHQEYDAAGMFEALEGTIDHPAFSPVHEDRSASTNKLQLPNCGCVIIKYRREGGQMLVTGYSMRLPQFDAKDQNSPQSQVAYMMARKCSTYLMGAFEMRWIGKQVKVGERHPHLGDIVRDYSLNNPVTLAEFKECLADANRLLRRDLEMIKDGMQDKDEDKRRSPEEVEVIKEVLNNRQNPICGVAMQEAVRTTQQAIQTEAAPHR